MRRSPLERPPVAVAMLDRGRALLLQAAYHRDLDAALRAWDTLVSDAGGVDEVLIWVRRGAEQRLLPALGLRSEVLELPGPVVHACRDAAVQAWGLNERLFHVVQPAVEALGASGISAVALKGIALLGDVYPEHHRRPVGDVDVLVRRHLVARALASLADAGWHGPPPYPPFWLAGRHAVNLGGPVAGPSIDLHWRAGRSVPHRSLRQPWPVDDLEELPRGHPLAETHLLRPVAERLIVQIAAHGMQPDNPTLSHWVGDLDRIIAANPALDGDRVARIAAEDGLSLQVQAGLRVVVDLLSAPLPFSLATLHPPTPRAERDERARWHASAQTADDASTAGMFQRIRRFLSYGRQHTLRRHWFARLQVALAVAATWARVHRA